MAYTPPDPCGHVHFTAASAHTPPNPCGGVFFGDSGLAVSIKDSFLYVVSDTVSVYPLASISVFDSAVVLESDTVQVEIKKGIYIADSYIEISSENGSIFILPAVHVEHSNIEITADVVKVKTPTAADLPWKINKGGMLFPWGVSQEYRRTHISVSWNDVTPVRTHEQILWGDNKPIGARSVVPWKHLDYIPLHYSVPWRAFELYDRSWSVPWNKIEHTYQEHTVISWGNNKFLHLHIEIPYLQPDQIRTEFNLPWGGTLRKQEVVYQFHWNYPDFIINTFDIVWGPIDWTTACFKKYWPPPECATITFGSPEITIKPSCNSVIFVPGINTHGILGQYCPYKHTRSGRRDPFDKIDSIKPPPEILPTNEEYYMYNTVTVQRLPDMAPIGVTSVSIRTDKSSYLWSFSLTVGKDDDINYLDMIKPSLANQDIYTDILITINQRQWVCRVESYRETRVFGRDSWQINGRSPSMELGSPQNKRSSFIYDPAGGAATAGATIIQDILDGTRFGLNDTNWTADFSAYGPNIHTGFQPTSSTDWGIQPRTFSWESATQIEAIKKLVDSIGAFIITEPNCRPDSNKILYVKPYYDVPPWHWVHTSSYFPTIKHTLYTDTMMEVGRTNEELADYNAVFVMGSVSVPAQHTNTTPGIPVVEIYRNGVGPDNRIYAPDIVDEYLQSWKACQERGRKILCETGFWIKHDLRLFSVSYPDSTDPTLPPLLLPGDFVRVVEKQKSWYGDVEAISIEVAVKDGTVYVSQDAAVNEYIG